MARDLVLAADFVKDVTAHVRWLTARREWSRIEGLERGLAEVEKQLAWLPACGVIMQREGGAGLRKGILRKLPMAVWYGYLEADADAAIHLLRLFHVRQSTPTPYLRTWRPRRR